MKRLLTLCALFALLAVGSASAATSKLGVNPANPVVGDPLIWSGCGYTPGNVIQLQAIHNTKTGTWILQIDETIDVGGCFSTADFSYPAPDAGKWTANVFEFSNGHKDATLNFVVG